MTDDPVAFRTLRDAPPPDPRRVRRRVRNRRMIRVGAFGVVAACLGAVLFVGDPDTVRDRGIGADPPRVRLAAVAEGPRGARPLAGGEVAADERVVFSVSVDRPAYVTISESDGDGTRVVWPAAGTWRVERDAFVGGDAPLAWRPEDGVVAAIYEVVACQRPDQPVSECGTDVLRFHWPR